jgi:hypothetical protein
MNKYWDDKDEIRASFQEKKNLFDYEVSMLNYCLKEFIYLNNEINQQKKNLIIEGLALHSRLLIDFFYPRENNSRRINDIKASDFVTNWDNVRPEIPQILFDAREKADKQLAHLTKWRLKIERDNKKEWNSQIVYELNNIISIFEQCLLQNIRLN